jgi:hypothetical protein
VLGEYLAEKVQVTAATAGALCAVLFCTVEDSIRDFDPNCKINFISAETTRSCVFML